MRILKLTMSVLLCISILGCGVVPSNAESTEEENTRAYLSYYYVQCDEQWADIKVGSLTIVQSACGICGICNAVYYLTGTKLDLVETAQWAHDKGYFNTESVGGCYRSVFRHYGDTFGSTYGLTATSFIFGSITSKELIEHMENGGIAVLHVPGHFMTLVSYNPETERYLVIDSMPGDYGKYDNRRKGITHTGGDWLSAETLSAGTTKVDGYSLFTRILSDEENTIILNASLKGIKS